MTLIDKAEALRLAREVRCGSCGAWIDIENPWPECCERPDWREGRDAQQLARAIVALPARGVGVKPLVWAHQVKMPSGNLEVRTQEDGRIEFFTHCGLYTIRDRGTPEAPMYMLRRLAAPLMGSAKLSELYEAAQKDHEARILAALAPTDAAHVNETPKSEHDGADVLTAAQARECCDLCGSDVTDMDGHLVHDEGCNGDTYAPAEQAREAAFLGVCECGMTGPCMWDQCQHPITREART